MQFQSKPECVLSIVPSVVEDWAHEIIKLCPASRILWYQRVKNLREFEVAKRGDIVIATYGMV